MRPLRFFISTTFLAVMTAQAGTAGTIPTLHNTGQGIAAGASDPYWTVTGPSPINGQIVTSPAYVTEADSAGFPFTWWVGDTSVSNWISPQPVYNNNTDLAGTFIYSTTFDLTGFDPTTASITIWAAADNWLASLNLDQQQTITSFAPALNFGFNTPITISGGFLPGLNRLDFVTTNIVQANANPSGAQIFFTSSIQAVATPEPASLYIMGMALLGLGAYGRKRSRHR